MRVKHVSSCLQTVKLQIKMVSSRRQTLSNPISESILLELEATIKTWSRKSLKMEEEAAT
jgi:hypothetical protein